MITDVISLIVVFLLMVLTSQGGMMEFEWYIDMPSMLYLLIPVTASVISCGIWKDFKRAFEIIRKKEKNYMLRDMKRSLEAVEYIQKKVLLSAAFMTITYVIYILFNLDNPQYLGPNISIALMVLFYALIIEWLLLPIQFKIKQKIYHYMEEE